MRRPGRPADCGCRGKSACPQKIGAILDPVRISLSVPSIVSSAGHDSRVGTVRSDLLVLRVPDGWRLCIAERFGAGDVTAAVVCALEPASPSC